MLISEGNHPPNCENTSHSQGPLETKSGLIMCAVYPMGFPQIPYSPSRYVGKTVSPYAFSWRRHRTELGHEYFSVCVLLDVLSHANMK